MIAPVAQWLFQEPPGPTTGPRWLVEWEARSGCEALAAVARDVSHDFTVEDVEITNGVIRMSKFPFSYQDPNDPRLDVLADELGLEPLIADARNDFERFCRVRTFVRNIAVHTEPELSSQYPYSGALDAFSILESVRKGYTLQCHAYSCLLIQCLATLGYTARLVSAGYSDPREHATVEAWSPENQKWILLDPDYDLAYVGLKDVPLSAYDVQRMVLDIEQDFREHNLHESVDSALPVQQALARYLAARPDSLRRVRVVRGECQDPRIPSKMRLSPTGMFLELYRSYAVSLLNNYLSVVYPIAHPAASRQVALPAGSASWLKDFDGELTDDLADLYWSMQTVRMAFQSTQRANEVMVQLGTVTPGFSHFSILLNGSAIKQSHNSFLWPLEKGRNVLSVQAVNARLLFGSPSRASVTLA